MKLPAWLRFLLPIIRGPIINLVDSVVDAAVLRALDEVDRLPSGDGTLTWLDRELSPGESAVAMEAARVLGERVKLEVGELLGSPAPAPTRRFAYPPPLNAPRH